jgi:hypothetical protein
MRKTILQSLLIKLTSFRKKTACKLFKSSKEGKEFKIMIKIKQVLKNMGEKFI